MSSSTYVAPPTGSSDAYGNPPASCEGPRYPWFPMPTGHVFFEVRCAECHTGLCQESYGVKLPGYKVPCVFVGECPTCKRKKT